MLFPATLRARRRAVLVAAVAVVGFSHIAQGVTKTWIGGNAVWSGAANWASANRPGTSDVALLRQGSFTATYDITSAPFGVVSVLIENGMTVSQTTSGTQLNPGSIVIGGSSAGTYTLGNGVLGVTNQLILGQGGGGAGSLNLTGGALSAATENVGSLSNGSINQTGGSNTVGNLSIGTSTGNGFYRLDGGLLDATGTVTLGANGSFTSTGGGSLSAQTTFVLAGGAISGTIVSNGTFISNSGVMNTNVGTTLINTGMFIYNGGDNSNWQFSNSGKMTFNTDWTAKALYSNSSSSIDFGARTINLTLTGGATNVAFALDGAASLNGGVLNVNSSTITFEQIGSTGSATFNHIAGTNNAANLDLGGGVATRGTYALSGGTLQVDGSEIVGDVGAATFNQSNGSHSTSKLFVGSQAGAFGTFLLSGGDLSVTTNNTSLIIGNLGTGAFQQTGGTVTAKGVALGFNANSTGTCIISGGAFSAQSLIVGDDNNAQGTFIQQGGSVGFTGTILVANFNINSRGTYSLMNGTLSSVQLTVGAIGSGTFSQSGGFNSTGTLNLVQSPGSSGLYELSGGSLNVADSINLASGAQFNQTGGALTVGSFSVSGPIVTPYTFTAGLLHLTNSSLTIGAGGLLGSTVSTSPTRSIITDRATSLDPLGLLTIAGGTFSTGSFITNGGSVALQSGMLALTASGLTIGSAQPLGASVKLDFGATISIGGSNALTVDPGAIVQLNGGAAVGGGTFFNNGQIVLSSPLATLGGGTLSNAGLLTGSGRVTSRLLNQSAGEVRADATDSLQFQNNLNNSAGKFTLNGGRIEFTQDLILTSTATVLGRGTLIASSGLSNAGTMTFSGAGNSDVFGAVTNTNRINVTGGNTTTFWNNVNTSTGTINVNTSSTVVFAGNLTGQSHIAGPGTKDYEGTASGGPIATIVGDTRIGDPAIVSADYLREDDVQVLGSLAIAANGSPANVSVTNTLSIPSGKLDLTNNDLIVTSTPLSAIAADITSAYNGGSWNGSGLTSSHAAAIAADSANLHKTALGYATTSSLGITNFDGQSVSGANVLVRYTYTGDANLDGVVNALDFNAIASNFGGSNKFWFTGDFNYDGSVNTADFNALASNFNQPALTSQALGTVVPEPGLCLLTGLLVAGRRRRPD